MTVNNGTTTPPATNGTSSGTAWIEDAIPAGGSPGASGGDAWTWVGSNPAPYSGSLAHQSSTGSGLHEHYFNFASTGLSVIGGEYLFTYVYLDPANPPTELMLSWNADNWEHRAYWGGNTISYGTDGTASRYYAGNLPAAGQWVRLEIPASAVGLEGKTITGMGFSLSNGRVTWDYTGKSAQGSGTPTPAPTPTLPTVTVAATDSSATIGTSDNAVFTFTRTGATSSGLTVNYTLGGSAVAMTDYRRPEGDMPVSVTIPAGAAAATLTIAGVANSTAANPETVVLTLSSSANYTVGSSASAQATILAGTVATNPPSSGGSNTNVPALSTVDYTSLELPETNDCVLHVLTPTLLELVRVNAKPADPARVDSWDFVNASGVFTAPAVSKFAVTANGQAVTVQTVGFKRRPLYAPLATRDLRVASSLYLKLASPIADGQAVEVKNPDASLWPATMKFTMTAHALRFSPAIHVNQEGYMPMWNKKAMVGYYLGNLGEMDSPSTSFSLVDVSSGATVYSGTLTNRKDVGYIYTPAPYQKVLEADFTGFTTAGEYQLVVPGLGASLPFLIDNGVAMAFTRTYALGLYHQRCGTDNSLPFTRFTHDDCHITAAAVPSPSAGYAFTWSTIASYGTTVNANNPAQTAPFLTSEATQLYPFVKKGQLDVTGGHHDAGDYSKYTYNSASLVHALMFAVDSLPNVASLDNMGIPESGDGISDLMQEAKWEADFLAKLQDTDGGFYFLVYPQGREYESNVMPDRGDPQVVWPKNTAVTAAAVAALAECASSPRFKAQYPTEAAAYMQKAQLGWQFLTNAIARYGKAGAYQKITHYGDDFTHDDELAWAAAAMFAATGNAAYHTQLKAWFDPSSTATWRWGWWHLYACYGNAVRTYAFAARSGRLAANQLDAAYLAKCEAEIRAAGNAALNWSKQNAYGSSFPEETKRVTSAGWYFSSEQAFDITVAYQLDARADYFNAILENLNYEGGCNPVNVSYVTGLGWKRQREIVHQYAQNDRRVLPPDGIPLGNIQAGFAYLNTYGSELGALCFPSDGATTAPYPFYDRWGDSFNVSTEFVHVTQGRSLASLAYLAALSPLRTQTWKSANATITGLPATVSTNSLVTATLSAPGFDLQGAKIVWEASGQEPAFGGTSFTFAPGSYGQQWVEAEAQLADGRRVFAVANLFASNSLPTVTVTASDATVSVGGTDNATYTFTRTGSTANAVTVKYQFSGSAAKWTDYRRPQGDMPESITIPAGAASATLTIMGMANSSGLAPATILLTLSADAAYNVGAPYFATANLYTTAPSQSPTLPTVTVVATDATTTIGSLTDGAVLTFARAGDTSSALTVNYALGGNAVKWVDYRRIEGDMPVSVTIPAGAAATTMTIMGMANSTGVSSQNVSLTLMADPAYTTGAATTATVNILPLSTSTATNVPLSSIQRIGTGMKLTWASTPGKIYRVSYKTSLIGGTWTNLGALITATGTTTTWTDTAATASAQRFYSVQVTN